MILIANNDASCNHIIIQSFHYHEDASLALWALFKGIFERTRPVENVQKTFGIASLILKKMTNSLKTVIKTLFKETVINKKKS